MPSSGFYGQQAVRFGDEYADAVGLCVLCDVSEHFADEKVVADSSFPEAAREIDFELDWQRCALRQGFKGWSEAAVGEQRRVDAAGERAEAGERVCELGTGGVQELNSRVSVILV